MKRLLALTLVLGLCASGPSALAEQVYGAIGEKWKKLRAEAGVLGAPKTAEADAAHGGRFNEFQHGMIYWHPTTGANAVWGAIRDRWLQLGSENFGYPITDETASPDGRGRFVHFRAVHLPGRPEGSIYFSPQTGVHEVHGAIRERWMNMGWERSPLGYPTSGEHQDGIYRRSNFQYGFIRWSPQGGTEAFAADGSKFCDFGKNFVLRPYGLIGTAWESTDGGKGPLGCPVGAEMNVPADNKGRIQTFEFGQIAWSPNQGGRAIQVAYQAGNTVEFFWVGTEPFDYDFWIVRTDTDNTNIGQQDIKAQRTEGWFVFRNAMPGRTYSFIAEGCNEKGFLGAGAKAGCRQGWMNRVAVTIKPTSNKKAPTLPDPASRGKGCFVDPGCVAKVVKEAASTVETVAKAVKAVKGGGAG